MKFLLVCFLLLFDLATAQTGSLKAVIFDFDGLDIGQTNLPDGDYKNYDLTYQITASPLPANDVISDRVLRLDLSWATGKGPSVSRRGSFCMSDTPRYIHRHISFIAIFFTPIQAGLRLQTKKRNRLARYLQLPVSALFPKTWLPSIKILLTIYRAKPAI